MIFRPAANCLPRVEPARIRTDQESNRRRLPPSKTRVPPMRRLSLRDRRLLSSTLLVLATGCVRADEISPPKGEVRKYTFEQSKIFPGTERDYWIYVPKQYDPAKPACLYVNQDGIQYRAPEVFDQLIHNKEMPVVIGVFITPGRVKAVSKEALDRFNRSFEYDGLGPDYVRFLLEELLPDVEKKTTADGRPIKLSRDGNDRAIAGASSGAICAFTAAWERPDSFRRVFSAIGTYVGLRGGNIYPSMSPSRSVSFFRTAAQT
jgi:gluconolactonase